MIKAKLDAFTEDHGRAASWIAVPFCMAPLLVCAVLGVALGIVLALPGLVLVMIAALPHWLRGAHKAELE